VADVPFMPYRIDLSNPADDALDRLVALGALDVEAVRGGIAALIPDGVTPREVRLALEADTVLLSSAKSRDDGSVWILSPRPVRAGRFLLIPSDMPASPGTIRLSDGDAFGTGLHPTTALCLEALDELLDVALPSGVLDIGTGSGVLALAALTREVPNAVGLDIDPRALEVAAENARLNDLSTRLQLICGSTEAVTGAWALVLANILAAPLMALAPAIARRVKRDGRLVLSGIPDSVALEVERAYQHLGMRRIQSTTRAGWTALVLAPTW
jgi:ribosomal protein L11 methyltransferase